MSPLRSGKWIWPAIIQDFLVEYRVELCKRRISHREMQKGVKKIPLLLLQLDPLLLCDSTLANLLGLKTSLPVKRLSEEGPVD